MQKETPRSRARLLAFSAVALLLFVAGLEGLARAVEALGPPPAGEAASPIGFQQLPDGDLLLPIEGFEPMLRFAPGLIDDGSLIVAPKQPEELRIVVLGGSAVGGWAVARRASFSAVLGRALQAATERPVTVLNLGRIGFASPQIAWMAERVLPQLDADVVLTVMGNNERHDLLVSDASPDASTDRTIRRLRRASALARFALVPQLTGTAAEPGPLPDPEDVADLERLEAEADARLVRSLGRIAAAAGEGRLVVASVPTNHRYRSTPHEWDPWLEVDEERRRQHLSMLLGAGDEQAASDLASAVQGEPRSDHPCVDADRLWYGGDLRGAQALYDACRRDASYLRADPRLNAALRAGADAVGAGFFDLAASVVEHSRGGVPGYDVFYDYCHYTPRGNVLVGHLLAGELASRLGLGTPASAAESVAAFEATWRDRATDALAFSDWLGVSADITALSALRYDGGAILHPLGEPGAATTLAWAGNRLADRGSVADLRWLEAAAASWCAALGLEPSLDPVAGNLRWLLDGLAGQHLADTVGVPDPIAACRAGDVLWGRPDLPRVDDI